MVTNRLENCDGIVFPSQLCDGFRIPSQICDRFVMDLCQTVVTIRERGNPSWGGEFSLFFKLSSDLQVVIKERSQRNSRNK